MSETRMNEQADDTVRCPGFVTVLVARCADGDPAALVGLMHLLYAPIRARLGRSLTDAEADELVGRALLHIWDRCASYDAGAGDVVAWLLDEAASATGQPDALCVAS